MPDRAPRQRNRRGRTLPAPTQSSGSAYKKWGLVTDALPVVGVCALSKSANAADVASRGWRWMGDRTATRRCGGKGLNGVSANDVTAIGAADAAAAGTKTQGDMWADADYRKQLIATLSREVIGTAFARAAGGQPV